ncbi:MAG TPA: sigma-54 dependent transcriptional regulator [bacterium]|jgi:transcriptional regulator with PAS, ATPase and Fis domain|nr:sigma-54 dependent transcriptional regulator [bacterium]HEV8703290.1 sigma-54 dependent transcriptional regulator [Candidatus Polarisedimenticolia bacterium]
MPLDTRKRLDLEAWLNDLKRLGGQARTLSEKHESVQNLMALSDLQMLEEATKRIIVSLSKKALYGLSLSHERDVARLSAGLRPRGGLEPGITLPTRDSQTRGYGNPSDHGPISAQALVVGPEPGSSADGSNSDGIIGLTESMRRVHHLIAKAAACSLPVLIQGESGTGKELVARAIHQKSGRQERRFFSENCSALSESLLESELFGHVRGAFTGADRDRKGILELAHGGTLFLDEIGDMSIRMQSKLLRALQEREFRPVGGKETIRVDVRVISATNRGLSGLIKEGAFRVDLLYRINVITIDLPPLRDRKADIPALVSHFLDRISAESGFSRREFSTGALELLGGYEWPGNIRELENVVQRAVALSESERIDSEELPDRIRHLMITEEARDYSGAGKGGEQLMIEKALHNFEGDKTHAARYIGWSRPKLYRRMRHYAIPIQFGRAAPRSDH